MIVRIVKLTFKKENIASFEQLFEETREPIGGFTGCTFLELYQDRENPSIFFTYSFWESEEDLENYRKSDFFKVVWGQTKKLFAKKAEAWSVIRVSR
jgi:quinol monooxygenase YgiN